MVPSSMYCLEHVAACIAVAVLSDCYQIQPIVSNFFYIIKNRGAKSESESESPGIEAMSQGLESESESMKLSRFRFWVAYYNSTRVRAIQK